MKTLGLYKGELFSTVWGSVEWVGDQLTGWGGSSQKPNVKINAPCFLNFFDLSDRYRDICKKRCLGTSWMGWGPVDWVGMVLPEAKLENKTTLFFEIFWFERPIARYLLKTILHCKGSRIWGNAITEVLCHCQLKCWVAQNQNDNVTGKWQGSIVGEFQLESSGECYRQRHTVVWGQPSFLYR